MSGTPIQQFNDFSALQPAMYLTGPDKIINDAQLLNYNLLSRFVKGRDASDIVRGGPHIKEARMYDGTSTATFYLPGQNRALTNPQRINEVSSAWRFLKDSMTWTEQEFVLNPQGGRSTSDYFKSVRKAKEMGLWTSKLGKMNAGLFTSPHSASGSMETQASATPLPYSLFAIASEDTTNYHASGWVTVAGIDPASDDTWRPQVARYNNLDLTDSALAHTGLLEQLHSMVLSLGYKAPPNKEAYFSNIGFQRTSIFTSKLGVTQLLSLKQENNDTYVYNDRGVPIFMGIPIEYDVGFDTAAVYYDGANYVTENASTLLNNGTAWSTSDYTRGARYYFLNFEYLRLFFHESMFMKLDSTVERVQGQYDTYFQDATSWYNLLPLSRRMGVGIVAPGA